jgi:CRISPR type I-E-associated protein CasB/Cse2
MNDIDDLLEKIRQAASPGHEDRGMLAALRRGFSEATEQYAWPYLAPYCKMTDPKQRAIWLTVAAAAATLAPDGLNQSGFGVGNLGATMRHLALGEDTAKDVEKKLASFEARFRRLLTCQTVEELCKHLVGVIRAAAAKGKKVNLKQLFWDLQKWENTTEPIKKVEWAQGYWTDTRDTHKEES